MTDELRAGAGASERAHDAGADAGAPARLERVEILLERSRPLAAKAAASPHSPDDRIARADQLGDRSAVIARRLGWVMALLAMIVLILLSATDRAGSTTPRSRQFGQCPVGWCRRPRAEPLA